MKKDIPAALQTPHVATLKYALDGFNPNSKCLGKYRKIKYQQLCDKTISIPIVHIYSIVHSLMVCGLFIHLACKAG